MRLVCFVISIALLVGCVSDMRAKQAAYFSKECEKEGYAAGTLEHEGCVSVKQELLSGKTSVTPVPVEVKGVKKTTTCQTNSLGRSALCY